MKEGQKRQWSAFGLQGTPGLAPRDFQYKKSIKNLPKIHQKKSEIFGPKKSEKIDNFGTDLGWFGGDLGTVRGYFRDGFGPILKSRKFEGPELKN